MTTLGANVFSVTLIKNVTLYIVNNLGQSAFTQKYCMRARVLFSAALVGSARGASVICQDGVWKEAPVQAIANLSVLPDVQCWRDPPCVHWKYLRLETCV